MMESRPSRGRGGSWRRGGRGGGGQDSGGSGGGGGEHRGRGRGGHHHRGRGKRDHYRGRGRGGGTHVAEFHRRDQDEQDDYQEEDDGMAVFSRRKLESNWDRYKESEQSEPQDDMPTQRGVDFNVLLQTAGDSLTHFRFAEEKDWEMDSFAASQISAVFVDLPALAQTLQQVPLHRRLNLEAELLQVSTPVELAAMTLAPKAEQLKPAAPMPPSVALKPLGSSNNKPPTVSNLASQALPAATKPPQVDEEEADEELDQLLGLQKPSAEQQPDAAATEEQRVVPEEECEEVKEVTEEKVEEVKDKDAKAAPGRKEVTEEDLEDWLDSMIS